MNYYKISYNNKDGEARQQLIPAHSYNDADAHAKLWVSNMDGAVYGGVCAISAEEIYTDMCKYRNTLLGIVNKINENGITDTLKSDLNEILDMMKYY
jgi:hypothetical protein